MNFYVMYDGRFLIGFMGSNFIHGTNGHLEI